MKFQNQFSLSLNPSFSRAVFPINETVDFRTTFPSTIDLDDKWEVALHSVITSKGFGVFTKFSASFESIAVDNTTDNALTRTWHSDEASTMEWDIKGQTWWGIKRQFKTYLRKWGIDIGEDGNRNLVLLLHSGQEGGGYLRMNNALCEALGIPTDPHSSSFRWWKLEKNAACLIRRTRPPPTRSFRQEHFAMYCDLVSDSIIGNAMCPIMEILSCEQTGMFDMKNECLFPLKHLTFRPLAKSSFGSIHIQLKTLDGKSFPYYLHEDLHEYEDVTFILVFRQNV